MTTFSLRVDSFDQFIPSQSSAGRSGSVDTTSASDTAPDMKVSSRSRVRKLPTIKAAARQGRTGEIVDRRNGGKSTFATKPTKTFGELAARAKGVYAGPRNLVSRERHGD